MTVIAVIAVIAAAVIVGLLAQAWKRRAGLLWGFLTLVVEMVVFMALVAAAVFRSPDFLQTEGGYAPLILVAAGVGGAVMLLVVVLLRRRG